MLRRTLLSLLLVAPALFGIAMAPAPVVHAATITVVNNDSAGEGFNDPTPKAPVGGNTGTTIGAQRLIAFQRAADIWGGILSSSVTIRVNATFDVKPCNASGAVLGSAGPDGVFRDFTGALVANTWYPVALANALNGSDLDPSVADISATFNSTIGTTCAFPRTWYYGLDGNAGTDIDFVSVVLHELGHGLGFLTFVNTTTGAKLLSRNDTYMRNLERHGATPADYPSMSDAQRVAASTDPGNLHWVGAQVRAASGLLSAGKVGDHVRMFAPNPQQSGSSVSHWDTVVAPNQIMEPSYTEPLDPELELALFQDLGWTLQGSPVISVTPASQSFGTVGVGSSADRTFTVQNTGGGMLIGTAGATAPFSIVSGASYSLGPSASQVVTVRFTPTSATTFSSNATFTGGGGASRGVSGTGTNTVTHTLTVASANPASGVAITVSPADNGALGNGTTQFSRVYNHNAVVNLTAPATAGGNTFQKWQRDGVDFSASAAVQVTLDANRTLTAVYVTPANLTLTVSVGGSALGTVTSSPPGINCSAVSGAGCSATFAAATSVTLTETPAAGATFKTWRTDCTGTSSMATVSMTANRLCKAIFSQIFTDPTLTPQVTTAKAVHMTELRSAVNQLRAVNGLGAFAFTDGTLTPTVTMIKRLHIIDLRTALCAAYTAAVLSCPTYATDPTITSSVTTVKAQHVIELRNNVRSLE